MKGIVSNRECKESNVPHEKRTGGEMPHSENMANKDINNRIGCTKEDEPMQMEAKSTLSQDDVRYIKDRLAEGIARMLVEKVAKSSDLVVDRSEPERYNPTSQKGGSLL